MTPISVIASLMLQFFYQNIVQLRIAPGHEIDGLLRKFVLALAALIMGISFFLLLFQYVLLSIWLYVFPHRDFVSFYIDLLISGLTIGVLGFIPYVLLFSYEDFKFQTLLSFFLTGCLTGCLLLANFYFSIGENIKYVCISYSIYHSISTICLWLRAVSKGGVRKLGISSAKVVRVPTFLFSLFVISYQIYR